MARKRARWRRWQSRLDPSQLVFIDKTWAKTSNHGRSLRGKRLAAKVPHGRGKTLTFIAALRCDGVTAPLVLDQPVNGEWFLAYVEQALVPTLKPGDVAVMDNLGSHKGRAARQTIRKARAHLLFLPPYSLDLNPFEQMFSKLKTLLRKADERCFETVWRRIGQLLDRFNPTECANYLVNSGYAPS